LTQLKRSWLRREYIGCAVREARFTADDVEAPVKPVAVFLSGVAIAIAGAFTRSCEAGLATQMAASWCGDASLLPAQQHAHCLGCAVMAVGGIIIATAALMLIAGEHAAPERQQVVVRT
jgi:hypothetical protein